MEPLIKESTDVTSKATSIRPSKVAADDITVSLQPSKEARSEEDDKLSDSKSLEEEENVEDFDEKVEDELSSTEFRTEKSVTMSSSSGGIVEPFTSDENKIDTTNEVTEKDKKAKETKPEGRSSAALSYKERLKERLAKEKAKLALKNFSKESLTSERRMFSLEEDEDQSHGSAGYKPRIPRERRFRSRFDQVLLLDEFHSKLLFSYVRLRERMTTEIRSTGLPPEREPLEGAESREADRVWKRRADQVSAEAEPTPSKTR